jgi:hypothetical protein
MTRPPRRRGPQVLGRKPLEVEFKQCKQRDKTGEVYVFALAGGSEDKQVVQRHDYHQAKKYPVDRQIIMQLIQKRII